MDGKERYVKNTSPGLNEDGTTSILAPDTGTQFGDAQAKFADQNSENTAVCQGRDFVRILINWSDVRKSLGG